MKLFRALLLVLLLPAFLLLSVNVQAQEPGDFVLGETSVVVPANGEATIRFQTFCLEFGKEFPSSLGTPDGRANDDVLRLVRQALEEDVPDQNPLAVQLAIWSQLENQTLDELYPDTDIPAEERAQSLLDSMDSVEVSPLRTDQGIALTEAVANGTITATSQDFNFVDTEMARPDGEPYHGEGTLVLTNQTDEDVQVYFPYGTVFRAENDSEQDIVAYATELEQLPTPTPMPTETPQPTPATIPETGTPGESSPVMPWWLIGIGVVMLSSAGILIARYQE